MLVRPWVKPEHYAGIFRNKLSDMVIGGMVVVGLYLTSLYSYLLFHCLAELFSIIIACGLFMIAWNTKEHTENHYLVYLGIAYFFVGVIDLFHTLGYKGMKIFTDYDFYANQLWIGARFLESITLLLFCMFAGNKRKISYNLLMIIYTILTALILASVFYWKIFPICFVEGKGQTQFKIISEYIICIILTISLIALYKNRRQFNAGIYQLLLWSIVFTIVSELAFTFYIDNYGFSNLVGHYAKIISFYLVYKSVIETGLRHPFQLMFRQIKDSEEQYKNLFNTALVGIFRTTLDGSQVLAANPATAKIFDYESTEAFIAEFVPIKSYVMQNRRAELVQKLYNDGKIEGIELLIKDRKGQERHLTLNAVLYPDYIEGAILDITEQEQYRLKVQEVAEQEALQRGKLEVASSVLHDVGNAITGVGTTVSRLLGEKDWQELPMLTKLEKMIEQKREALTEALGPGKGEALLVFVRELIKYLESHINSLHSDYRNMAKIISHINEILHLQRQYVRDGQTGKRQLSDPAKLIDDALSMSYAGFEKRGIEILRSISPDLPQISGDRTKLLRVFLNVLKNACEAFDQTDIKENRNVSISAEFKDESLWITIEDNGIGFASDLAESFFNAGFSTKNRDSGFGLFQCREIIEAYGGTIRLESKGIGMGAKAMIELPTASSSTNR